MLEIYLFVEPLGTKCMRCENDVLKLDNTLDGTVQYQFIPLLNMQTITNTLDAYGLNSHDLKLRNNAADTLFQIIMDYKAALFQGRKKGRAFLLHMQQHLVCDHHEYSLSLTKKIAQMAKLDLEMFTEDRTSKLARQAFTTDQKMATEMGVSKPSSAVVFDANNSDDGVLIDNFDYQTLVDICTHKTEALQKSAQDFVNFYQHQSNPNFHIL